MISFIIFCIIIGIQGGNMIKITMPKIYRVDIIESERGWGCHLDESLYFDNEIEAKNYATNYNKKYNTEAQVPDWYMYAKYMGKVQ